MQRGRKDAKLIIEEVDDDDSEDSQRCKLGYCANLQYGQLEPGGSLQRGWAIELLEGVQRYLCGRREGLLQEPEEITGNKEGHAISACPPGIYLQFFSSSCWFEA